MKNMDLLASQFNPFNGTQKCIDVDPEIFFPEYENNRSNYPAQIQRARDVCEGCGIKEDCIKYALQFPGLEGVWGGTTPHDRKRMRRLNGYSGS